MISDPANNPFSCGQVSGIDYICWLNDLSNFLMLWKRKLEKVGFLRGNSSSSILLWLLDVGLTVGPGRICTSQKASDFSKDVRNRQTVTLPKAFYFDDYIGGHQNISPGIQHDPGRWSSIAYSQCRSCCQTLPK